MSEFFTGTSLLLAAAAVFFGLGLVVWFTVIYPRSSSKVGGESNGVWANNNLAAGEEPDSDNRRRPVEHQSGGLSDVDII